MDNDELTILDCIALLKKFNESRSAILRDNSRVDLFKKGALSINFKWKKVLKERAKFYTPEHSLDK